MKLLANSVDWPVATKLLQPVHAPVIDAARGRAALLRTTTCHTPNDSVNVGGIDVLTIRDGRIAQAWSLQEIRPFRY
jgi:hypothetical protein